MLFQHQGKELASSVVSNVKHALGLKEPKPGNKGQCSRKYWVITVHVVGTYYNVSEPIIQLAIDKYALYNPGKGG
ncbi:hypothetical protein [Spirosoma koreense]